MKWPAGMGDCIEHGGISALGWCAWGRGMNMKSYTGQAWKALCETGEWNMKDSYSGRPGFI